MTNRPRALAVLIAVFFVGAIAGAAGSYYWLKQKPEVQSNHRRQDGPPGLQGRQRWYEFLRSLQMTPEQDARFREIMMESRKQMEDLRQQTEPLEQQMNAMWEKQMPKLEAIRAETNRRFAAILNPEQQKKFDAFMKESEEMRRRPPRGREFEPPPPGGPPPGNPGNRH